MGTVLTFKPTIRTGFVEAASRGGERCEIVIFPGVRIERHDLDLSHRLRDSAGRDTFNGIGDGDRKTS
jgi:hypothetical protein